MFFFNRVTKIIMMNLVNKSFVSYLRILINKVKDIFTIGAERQHGVTLIESLYQSIVRCYSMCPEFCIGLIQDAFNEAFNSSLTKKVCFCHFV